MICGHLSQRMDSILPMGNVPRIHMVDGLLMSSGYPVPVSILPNEQKQKEALGLTCCCSGPGGVSLISSAPSLFPSTSPPLPTRHLSGQTSTADKVSFTKISRAHSLPPQSGSQDVEHDGGDLEGQALSWKITRDLYNAVAPWLTGFLPVAQGMSRFTSAR